MTEFEADNTNPGNGPQLSDPNTSLSATAILSVWDGDWAILEEYTTGNVLVQKYLQGYHGLVKTLVDNIYFYQDELGSTSHIANASGALLEYYKYDSLVKLLSQAGEIGRRARGKSRLVQSGWSRNK